MNRREIITGPLAVIMFRFGGSAIASMPLAFCSVPVYSQETGGAVQLALEIYNNLDEILEWNFGVLDFLNKRVDQNVPRPPCPPTISAFILDTQIRQIDREARNLKFPSFIATLPTLEAPALSPIDAGRNDLAARVMLFVDACTEILDVNEGQAEASNSIKMISANRDALTLVGTALQNATRIPDFWGSSNNFGLAALDADSRRHWLQEIADVIQRELESSKRSVVQRRSDLLLLASGLISLLSEEQRELFHKASELFERKSSLDRRGSELDSDQGRIRDEQALFDALKLDIQELAAVIEELRGRVKVAANSVAQLRSEVSSLATLASSNRANWTSICTNHRPFDQCNHSDLKESRYFAPLRRMNAINEEALPSARARLSELRAQDQSSSRRLSGMLAQARTDEDQLSHDIAAHSEAGSKFSGDFAQYLKDAYESRADVHQRESLADSSRVNTAFQQTARL